MKNRFRYGVSAVALACAAGLAQGQDFPQAFDDIGALTTTGNWFTQNNSVPVGPVGYFQGNATVFPAQASPGYLGVNFNSVTGDNTISNWFVTPALNLANGQQFTFWARTVSPNIYPDRLQVRMSTAGFGTNVGTLPTDVGTFTTLLLDINPTYQVVPNPGAFPEAWTQFNITISGLGGPTVGRVAFRYFCVNGGPAGANSNYIGIDEATYNGTVAIPPTGSCCLVNGTCQILTQNACVGSAGVYGGNTTPCGACPTTGYIETADVGDLPATAAPINGNGQPLTTILGTLDLDDVDMFKFKICNEANFTATTVGSGTSIDTMLFLFNSAGVAQVMSDDTSITVAQFSTLTSQFVPSNGDYYLAISSFNNTTNLGRMPLDASSAQIFNALSPAGFVYPEWAPNGPSTTDIVASWSGATETANDAYRIFLTGSCFLGGAPVCYADCDGVGGLTANDFICFLTKYNQGDSYADCDTVGGLTANDFICFLTKYNQGCS